MRISLFNLFHKRLFSIPCAILLMILGITAVFASSAGSLDNSFGAGGIVIAPLGAGSSKTRAIAIQGDGKILAGGYAYDGTNNLDSSFALARFRPDGSADNSFGTGGRVITPIRIFSDEIYSLAIQPGGKIIAAGYSNRGASGQYDPFDLTLVRYNSNGTLDTTFGTGGIVITQMPNGGWGVGKAIVIERSGKIVVTGLGAVVRYNSNGSLDTTFGSGGIVLLPQLATNTLVIQNETKIIVAGRGGPTWDDFTLARLDSDGSPDTSFGTNGRVFTVFGGNAEVYSLDIQKNGKIVAAGGAYTDNTDYDFALTRYHANGSPDNSFGTNGKVVTSFGTDRDIAASVVVQRNGKILTAGRAVYNGSNGAFALARYKSNGALDNSFGSGGKVTTAVNLESEANAVAIQRNGKIVTGGSSLNPTRTDNYSTLTRYRNNPPIFDYDGDSLSDVSVFRPQTGGWHIEQSSLGSASIQFGTASDQIVPADYSGDDLTDIAVWRPSGGTWYIFNSQNNTFYSFPFGTIGDIPTPGDFDGDGRADAAVYRPASGTWYINQSSGGTVIRQFGIAEDKPVVADYDDDGKADIAVFRPSTGVWWIDKSSEGVAAVRFGSANDKPVAGDYTGDGIVDVAFWRPASGEWFVLRSEDYSYFSFPFGMSGDIPAPGDYDGDGIFDATVFRPSSSVWYIQKTTDGTAIVSFGAAGDIPAASAFVP
jgi:uncharacterized delta-60 repeat protein